MAKKIAPHPNQIKPNVAELVLFRSMAFDNLGSLTLLERVKLRLALSIPAITFSRFLFNTFFVYEKKGFAIYRLGRIRALFVYQKYQGQGIGSSLVRAVCLHSTFKKIIVKPVESSKGFYKKKGFKEFGGFLIKKNG